MRIFVFTTLVAASIILAKQPAAAEERASATPETPAVKKADAPATESPFNKALSSFGVGPAMTINAWHKNQVEDAALDPNGIVRINKTKDSTLGIFLEGHYLFETDHVLPFVKCPKLDKNKCGVGPFVGLQPGGSGEVIEAFGAGIMWGFRSDDQNGGLFNKVQMNIGVGIIFYPHARTLGDGILKNQPLPAGETAIRYKEDYQSNIMVMITLSPL